MHIGNRQWLDDQQRKYGNEYAHGSVLELGSLNLNGSARESIFAATYVGVDQTAGLGVDVVCNADATDFQPANFDAIICTSMLEHDPAWRVSLDRNLEWLKPGGLLFLSWGAEGNPPHGPYPWAAVPVGDVLQWAVANGLQILDACWEGTRYHPDCPGCYGMVLRHGA